MVDLIALAERVEAADGPDRELDALIYTAVHDRPAAYGRGRGMEPTSLHPAYTASLDAALMLVPEQYRDDWLVAGNAACLGYDSHYWSEGEADHIGRAATPALAIAAAALRAHQGGSNEG